MRNIKTRKYDDAILKEFKLRRTPRHFNEAQYKNNLYWLATHIKSLTIHELIIYMQYS